MNNQLRLWILQAAALLMCGGCAAALQHAAPMPPTVPNLDVRAEFSATDNGPYLYVGGHKLSKYALGSSEPLRSTKINNYVLQSVLALDSQGNLIEANGNPSSGQIYVYDARSLRLIRTFNGAGYFSSMVVNRKGYIYTSLDSYIAVFAPGATKYLGAIKQDAHSVIPLAFDRTGNLYAGNSHFVSIYAPIAGQWQMKFVGSIRVGVNMPQALAIAPSGNLYVGNWPSHNHGWVSVYDPNGVLVRKIGVGIRGPVALALDANEQLYVGNVSLRGNNPRESRGWVSVYPFGATQPSLRITRGIYSPVYLTVGPKGDLYVSNEYYGVSQGHQTLTVYSSGGSRLLRTITKGISGISVPVIGTP